MLISGGGSNLQALIDATEAGHINGRVVVVVSNRKKAYGLERAEKHGIDRVYFPLKPYKETGKSRETYDADLAEAVALYQPDLIVLAGWMHILSPAFLDVFERRVINLHPALPGEFAGTDAIERAYEDSRRRKTQRSGVMVHYAIPEVDAGDVIIQAKVPILKDDTLETFADRMHKTEHRVLVQAVALLAEKLI